MGEIATVGEAREALGARIGQPLHHSVVHRFLNRNGWRRTKTRPSHVKPKPQEQEAFKKNSPLQWPPILSERDPKDVRPVALTAKAEG